MSTRSALGRSGRLTDSPNRLLGAVFGVVYLLVGLLGFAVHRVQRLRRHQHRRQDPRHLRGQPAAQHRPPADRCLPAVRRASERVRGQGRQHRRRRGLPAAGHRRSVHPRQRREHPVAQQRGQRAAPRERRAAAGRRPVAGQERPRATPPWSPASEHAQLTSGFGRSDVARCWAGFASLGAGLVHFAVVTRAPRGVVALRRLLHRHRRAADRLGGARAGAATGARSRARSPRSTPA